MPGKAVTVAAVRQYRAARVNAGNATRSIEKTPRPIFAIMEIHDPDYFF